MVVTMFGSTRKYVKMLDKIGNFVFFFWLAKMVIFTVLHGLHFRPLSSVEFLVDEVVDISIYVYLVGYFMVFRLMLKKTLLKGKTDKHHLDDIELREEEYKERLALEENDVRRWREGNTNKKLGL